VAVSGWQRSWILCLPRRRHRQGRPKQEAGARLVWRPYDPDDINEPQIRITLKRIANIHRRGKLKAAET
jgi:hypothetical protein